MTTTEPLARHVERLASESTIWSADDLVGGWDGPTDAIRSRAEQHDKIPRWSLDYIGWILTVTMRRYVGIQKTPRRAHVFVLEGRKHTGVYEAAEPWVDAVGGDFASQVRDRGWKESTAATMLGGVCEVLLGGRIYEDYYRGDPGDDETLDMFDESAPAPPTEPASSYASEPPPGAVPIDDDFDAGPPRVALRCPACDEEHGDWKISRVAGGVFLRADCGKCEAAVAYRYHGYTRDPS